MQPTVINKGWKAETEEEMGKCRDKQREDKLKFSPISEKIYRGH